MRAWLKRFGLHLAAAVGATGVFVAAAAVGANQTRQQEQITVISQPVGTGLRTRTPAAPRRTPPPAAVVTPAVAPPAQGPAGQPPATATPPEAQAGQPQAEQPQTGQPPAGQPPAGQPQTGQPRAGQPQPGQPQTGQPPAGQPPAGQPPAGQPQTGQPQAGEPQAGQLQTGQPQTGQPQTGQPQTGQPQTGQPQDQPTARPRATSAAPRPTPATEQVIPERSLAGTIKEVQPDALVVTGVGGREWHVIPAPGALIRLNGKAAKLEALQPGENVVVLGQAQPGPGQRFLAHAITAKRT